MRFAVKRTHWPLIAVGLAAIFLVAHSLVFNFVTDDAYISFVYARNLAENGELVFNLGDRVEGYTNFLWTVLLAVAYFFGLGPEISSLVFAALFAIVTLVVSARLCRRLMGDAEDLWWTAVPAFLLAGSASFACWTSGGLETQMFACWMLLAIDHYVASLDEPNKLRRAGLYLALAAMTRPEGLLLSALVGLHWIALRLVRDRSLKPRRDELLAAACFLGLWLPYFLWRYWYYGFPFPNTYYVKAAGEVTEAYKENLLNDGLHYVSQWAKHTGVWGFAVPALLAFACKPRTSRFVFASLAVPTVVVYLVYVARVGGDFMGLYRFVLPLLPLIVVLAVLGLRTALTRIPGPPWLAMPIVGLLVAGFAVWQVGVSREAMRHGNWKSDNGIDTPSYLEIYTDDRGRIGKHMRECFRPDDFSIVGGAGAQPYHGRMRGIDVFGLVSKDVAHNVKPTNPRAGHNKWAPDTLLAKYEPDFVFSCYSIHPQPRRPRLNCNPSFWLRRGYKRVTLHIPGLRQQGEYYTFLVRKDREFSCPGLLE